MKFKACFLGERVGKVFLVENKKRELAAGALSTPENLHHEYPLVKCGLPPAIRNKARFLLCFQAVTSYFVIPFLAHPLPFNQPQAAGSVRSKTFFMAL